MKSEHITEREAIEYRKLEDLAIAANKALDALALGALQADLPMETKAAIIGWVEERTGMFRGLPYFLHPQSEWTGGETFKMRHPHIVELASK